jgi:hypothetical protein
MTDSYFPQGQELTSACFPDNYDPHMTAVYSPGLCPSAYTPVRMQEGSSLSDTGVLTCCPTYAIFEARNTSQNNPFMSTMACQSFFDPSGIVEVTKFLSANHYEVGIAMYGSADVLNAYGVIIAPKYQSSGCYKYSCKRSYAGSSTRFLRQKICTYMLARIPSPYPTKHYNRPRSPPRPMA